jgi:uncharacterized protein
MYYLRTNGGELVSFECYRCGDCCSHLGLVHVIKEDYGNNRFLISNQYTGEKTLAVVEPDKLPLFLDRSTFLRHPEACPFFRVDQLSLKGYCTIHLTRPEICKDFGCWRMLIINSGGERAGRIMHQRFLASEDEALTRVFEEQIKNLPDCSDEEWDARVTRILTKSGYSVQT